MFCHWIRNSHGSRMVTVLQNVRDTPAAPAALTPAAHDLDRATTALRSSSFCSHTLKSLHVQVPDPSCKWRQHYKLCCHLLFWKCKFKGLSTMAGNSVYNVFQLMRLDQANHKLFFLVCKEIYLPGFNIDGGM